MDQTKPELTFEESMQRVVRTLPPPVRAYIAGGKCTIVVQDLMKKRGLHTDQAGVLEREVMLLLMGIDTPEEFNKSLVEEARLSPQMISAIMQDLNARIFMPLREEIQKGGRSAPQAATAQAKLAAAPAPRPGAPRGPWPARPPATMPPPQVYAPPPQSPRYTSAGPELPAGMRFVAPSPPSPPRQAGASSLGQVLRAVTPPQNLPGAPPPSSQETSPAQSPPTSTMSDIVSRTSVPPPPPPPPSVSVLSNVPVRKPSDPDPYREPIE